MTYLMMIWHSPLFRAALTGALVAARMDYNAFASFKTIKDMETYSWSIAAFRWFQGAVVGFMAATGFNALS